LSTPFFLAVSGIPAAAFAPAFPAVFRHGSAGSSPAAELHVIKYPRVLSTCFPLVIFGRFARLLSVRSGPFCFSMFCFAPSVKRALKYIIKTATSCQRFYIPFLALFFILSKLI